MGQPHSPHDAAALSAYNQGYKEQLARVAGSAAAPLLLLAHICRGADVNINAVAAAFAWSSTVGYALLIAVETAAATAVRLLGPYLAPYLTPI